MTNNNHPITPSPELLAQIRKEAPHGIRDAGVTRELHLITASYRAGADQELEACCEWLETGPYGFSIVATAPSMTKQLRAARRPKPKGLSEEALKELDWLDSVGACNATVIRRALKRLQELEKQQ